MMPEAGIGDQHILYTGWTSSSIFKQGTACSSFSLVDWDVYSLPVYQSQIEYIHAVY